MRSVLVTGGTGAFGRAFVARLLSGIEWTPGDYRAVERICIYSRGEHTQAQMRREFKDDPRLRWLIGDVRDADRLRVAMDGCDTVIHAAALKRIEVGQENPTEMVKTNVNGAINVVRAACDAHVQRVVALSSDKAYQPVSPYGQSKALAETIFLAANRERVSSGTSFTTVRYGNVSGSTGSVIPTWRKMIADGDVVPITDPDCTRFWMTLDEAVDLVLKAREIGVADKPLIPVLPAYRLGDLAVALGVKDNRIIGLPAWEKKHESMSDTQCSETARRMSVDELREALKNV